MGRAFGLTPARLDMLRVVRNGTTGSLGDRMGLAQANVVRALGVSRATVSEMLASLEGLGLVRRWSSPDDRRTRRVALTPRGLAILKRVCCRVMHRAQRALRRAVCTARTRLRAAFVTDGEALESRLSLWRKRWGDRATFHQPWHPDD